MELSGLMMMALGVVGVILVVWISYEMILRVIDRMVDSRPKTVLVTGCASGIARSLVQLLIDNGDRSFLLSLSSL